MTRYTPEQKKFILTRPGIYKNRVIEQLDSAMMRVAFILNNYPKTRNNDALLIQKYRELVDGAPVMPEELVLRLTCSESIRRVRQVIQNEFCLYLPTDPTVLEKRSIKKDAVESWISMAKRMKERGVF